MSTSTIPVFLFVAGSRNSPSSTKLTTEATAPPCAVDVGRIMETGPSFAFRNNVGSGMIRLVWKSSAGLTLVPLGFGSTPLFRFGNERSPSVIFVALPALSCHVWKCIISDPPILNRTRKTSKLVTFIANTAGFHFAFIEQGGSSLYPALAQKVTNLEVLRVLLSIGGSEIMHFQTWHDKAG